MDDDIVRREPTPDDLADLGVGVDELTWNHACRLAGVDPATARYPVDPTRSVAERRAAVLALLGALHDIDGAVDAQIGAMVRLAGGYGAAGPAIGEVLGITGAAVRKRWPLAVGDRPGPRPLPTDPPNDPPFARDLRHADPATTGEPMAAEHARDDAAQREPVGHDRDQQRPARRPNRT